MDERLPIEWCPQRGGTYRQIVTRLRWEGKVKAGLCLGVSRKIFAVIKIARTRADCGRGADWLSAENKGCESWDGRPCGSESGGIDSDRVEDCRSQINRRERGGRRDESGD